MGYSQLGLEDLDQEDPLHDPLTEIQAAGERAAALTHQLLAFSRKEVLQPEVIDLNEVVDDMSKMLLRLIGDVVELQVVLEAKPAAVRADRNRLEQVIMNLTVNARDAMQQGGVLRVQTENIEVAQTDPAHPNLQAGRYVLLSYVDNGKGMDADTMAQVFEPFFTTKPPGRGTGMGLAMVHGIVKQSGGHIQVASQVGDGTTFCIYLPQLQVAEDNTDTATNSARMPRGRETVLLVDNEAGVRKMVRLFLEDLGYHVLGAGDTDEAIAQFDQHGGVDLLLADVIVPGIGITQLVAHLAALQPGLQVLYLSGHPDAVLERHGVDPITAELVHKPINKIDLARRVREVLDEGMIFEVEE